MTHIWICQPSRRNSHGLRSVRALFQLLHLPHIPGPFAPWSLPFLPVESLKLIRVGEEAETAKSGHHGHVLPLLEKGELANWLHPMASQLISPVPDGVLPMCSTNEMPSQMFPSFPYTLWRHIPAVEKSGSLHLCLPLFFTSPKANSREFLSILCAIPPGSTKARWRVHSRWHHHQGQWCHFPALTRCAIIIQ